MKAFFNHTWIFTSFGYLAGFLVAELTGVRNYGAPFLILGAAIASWVWLRRNGFNTFLSLIIQYLVFFGLSHVISKYIGAWPSVFLVTAIMGVMAFLADRSAANQPQSLDEPAVQTAE